MYNLIALRRISPTLCVGADDISEVLTSCDGTVVVDAALTEGTDTRAEPAVDRSCVIELSDSRILLDMLLLMICCCGRDKVALDRTIKISF